MIVLPPLGGRLKIPYIKTDEINLCKLHHVGKMKDDLNTPIISKVSPN